MWSLDTQVWPPRYISRGAARVTNLPPRANRLSENDLQEVLPDRALSMPTALGAGMAYHSWHRRDLNARTWIGRALLTLLLASPRVVAGAQGYEAMQPMATRADLTALSTRLARGSDGDRRRASALQARLREGDFRAGDRIRLVIDGNITQDDTITVVAGSKVQLKDVGEVSLAGVLRSELQDHMSKQLSRYIKDVRVRATPLIRLSVLGPVGKAGFYYMPTDIPLGDAVMRAGGPGGNADLNKSVIRRNTEELYDSRNTRTAMNEGLTLDQLSLRDGDSIEVGEKSTGRWAQIVSGIGLASSLIWALSYVSRR